MWDTTGSKVLEPHNPPPGGDPAAQNYMVRDSRQQPESHQRASIRMCILWNNLSVAPPYLTAQGSDTCIVDHICCVCLSTSRLCYVFGIVLAFICHHHCAQAHQSTLPNHLYKSGNMIPGHGPHACPYCMQRIALPKAVAHHKRAVVRSINKYCHHSFDHDIFQNLRSAAASVCYLFTA